MYTKPLRPIGHLLTSPRRGEARSGRKRRGCLAMPRFAPEGQGVVTGEPRKQLSADRYPSRPSARRAQAPGFPSARWVDFAEGDWEGAWGGRQGGRRAEALRT